VLDGGVRASQRYLLALSHNSRYPKESLQMRKSERIANAVEKATKAEQYSRQETAMRSFIDVCRDCICTEQWYRHYPEIKQSAGETFHIVRDLVYVLAANRIPIVPKLRKSLDAVILECGLDRHKWSDLQNLNYDEYWKSQYGYSGTSVTSSEIGFCPHSPEESSG
jgi:hypothetical protein